MAGDAGSAGRISKTAFIGTSSAFFAVCMIASIVRFYVRFVHLREFGWDDGFLIFGLLCLIAGMALLLVVMDVMYQTEAFVFLEPGEMLPEELLSDIGGMITKSFWYRKLSAGALTLMWLSICCVKFSFMAFFKRLIRQMPGMNRYWWFTTGFNIIVSAYGVAVYWASCPYFDESQSGEAMQCVMGDGLKVAVAYSTSLMVLDIFGDLFILAIPCILIYQIRVRFTQKIALSLTLCLTIIMIIITILRIAGLQYKGKLDSVWETFFIIVGAEIGLTLVAITAFRALYVTKNKNRKVHDTITTFNWYTRAKTVFKYYVSKATGKDVSHQSGGFENIDMGDGRFIKQEIPHGTMTGVKTFMDGNGRTYRPDFTGKQSTLSTMHTVTTLVEETGSERSHYRSQV